MAQLTWAGGRAIILAVTALFLLPLQAQAERDWEFSVGAFGGGAFHSNEDLKINSGDTQFSLSWNGTRCHAERLWNIWRQTHRLVSPKEI